MSSCKFTEDCNYLNECINKKCVHYGVFDPEGNIGLEVFCYVLIILIVGISKVGGIGGGIVKVPIMQLILQYETKQATYLIYPLLFSTGVTNAYLMMIQKHPFDNRPLIRYNVALMMLPMIMVGSSIGIMVNTTAPDLALTIILCVFLICITPYLYSQFKNSKPKPEEIKQAITDQKYQDQEKKHQDSQQQSAQNNAETQKASECREKQNSQNEPYLFEQKDQQQDQIVEYKKVDGNEHKKDSPGLPSDQKLFTQNKQNEVELAVNSGKQLHDDKIEIKEQHEQDKKELINTQQEETEQQKQLMAQHSSLKQYKKIIAIFVVFLTTQFFNFLKGGKALQSFAGITLCSDGYWGTFAANLIIMLIYSIIIWIWIKSQMQEKEKANFKWGKIDVRFTNLQLLQFAGIGLFAGLFTSATGLGSGLIMVPGLLYAKLDPRSAASVSGFVITFLSSNSLILLLLEGYLEYLEIIIYLIMGLLAGTVFAKLTYFFMQKYKAHRAVILIVLVVDVLNILSAIAYLIIKIENKGINYVLKTSDVCTSK